MKTRYFDTTGEAYDACQSDDVIEDGDAIVVKKEKVVGIAGKTPVAITKNAGDLHAMESEQDTIDAVGAEAWSYAQGIREGMSLKAAMPTFEIGGDFDSDEFKHEKDIKDLEAIRALEEQGRKARNKLDRLEARWCKRCNKLQDRSGGKVSYTWGDTQA